MPTSGDHKSAHAAAASAAQALQRAALAEARRLARGLPTAPSHGGFAAGASLFDALFSTPAKPKRSVRVKSPAGLQTFHMRVTPIVVPSSSHAPLSGQARSTAATGQGSSATSAAAHAAYVERPEAVEMAPAATGVSLQLGSSAPAAESYIAREPALEAASFGNIAATLAERQDFWRAVETCERQAGDAAAIADFRKADRLAAAIAADPHIAGWIRDAAAGRSMVRRPLDDATQAEVAAALAAHPAADAAHPVRVAAPRSGRVQHRVVLELPHDMTPAQRLDVARRFCTAEFADLGAPYHCALHAPNIHNDHRNYHLHIIFHDRPAKKVIDPDTAQLVWDFAYSKTLTTSSRHKRTSHPLRQPKIRAFSDRGWPAASRARFAAIVNAVRAEAEQAPIYDPRSYKDMGVSVAPLPPLTRQEYFDAMKGHANPDAVAKMELRWQRAQWLNEEAAGPAPTVGPQTPVFRETEREVARRAPVSVTAAKLLHGRYIDALERSHAAALEQRTLDLMSERAAAAAAPPLARRTAASLALAVVEAGIAVLQTKAAASGRGAARNAAALASAARDMRAAARTVPAGALALPSPGMAALARRMGLEAGFEAAQHAARLQAERLANQRRLAAERAQKARAEKKAADEARLAAQQAAKEARRIADEAKRAAHATRYPAGHPFYPNVTPRLRENDDLRNAYRAAGLAVIRWIGGINPEFLALNGRLLSEAKRLQEQRDRNVSRHVHASEQMVLEQKLLAAALDWRDGLATPGHPARDDPDHPYAVRIDDTIATLTAGVDAKHSLIEFTTAGYRHQVQRHGDKPCPIPELEASRSSWSSEPLPFLLMSPYFRLAEQYAVYLTRKEREAERARIAAEKKAARDAATRREAERQAEITKLTRQIIGHVPTDPRFKPTFDRLAEIEYADERFDRNRREMGYFLRQLATGVWLPDRHESPYIQEIETPIERARRYIWMRDPRDRAPTRMPSPAAQVANLHERSPQPAQPPHDRADQPKPAIPSPAHASAPDSLKRGLEAALASLPGRATAAETNAAARATARRFAQPTPEQDPIRVSINPDGGTLALLRRQVDPYLRASGEPSVDELLSIRALEIDAWGEKTTARTYKEILAAGAKIDAEWRRRNPGKSPPAANEPLPTRPTGRGYGD